VIEQMLRNMFLGTADAAHDRVLDVSTALTGTRFFVPDADFLDDIPDAGPEEAAQAAPESPPPAAADGSLGIGGRRG
jgi:putative iron-dependent peroxidase